MGFKYRITADCAYFITSTVIDWIDLFTRKNHKLIITESLKYCQKNKGLAIYGWCLMPSHLHLLASAENEIKLSDIIRDFKKYTSVKLIESINGEPESRREWMLNSFAKAAKVSGKNKNYKIWQDGNHPEEVYSISFTKQKLHYIHNNPVEEMIVSEPQEYLFSSARNYAGQKGLLEIEVLNTGIDKPFSGSRINV